MAPMAVVPLVPLQAMSQFSDVADPLTFQLTPRSDEEEDDALGSGKTTGGGSGGGGRGGEDARAAARAAAFPIEVEFAFSSPRRRGRETSFHALATPRATDQEEVEAGEEDFLEMREDMLSTTATSSSSSPRTQCSQAPSKLTFFSHAIEDEFAAFTAAQALHELGPGRSEAESAWRMCLLREKLKCMQRARQREQRKAGFAWAPALAAAAEEEEGQDRGAAEEAASPARADACLWPATLGPELAELVARGGAAAEEEDGSAAAGVADNAVASAADPAAAQSRPSAPPASDPFFHFSDIDLAEERAIAEERALLSEVLRGWAAAALEAQGITAY